MQSNKLVIETIEEMNQGFTFHWNDYRTIEPNKKKIVDLKSFVESKIPFNNISDETEKLEFGRLCYKLGTYYNHITHEPVSAFNMLVEAKKLLTGKELAWVKNNIAYSFQQKLNANKKLNDIENAAENYVDAMYYCEQVIKEYELMTDLESISIVGFAYCVKAITEFANDKLNDAISNYRIALNLYEKYNLLDDQYARAKNRYAQFLALNGDRVTAHQMFEELSEYWKEIENSPYQARFYEAYGDYLVNIKPESALENYNKSCQIYSVLGGEDLAVQNLEMKISGLVLKKPYSPYHFQPASNHNNQLDNTQVDTKTYSQRM